MYQAMKYLDEIAMKWDTIEEQLENLDLKNVFHIMWVYRNITHIYKYSEEKFKEIINELKTVTINEYFPANVILQFISQLIYRIYSLKEQDEELEFVKKKCEYIEIIEEEDLSELKKYIYSLCIPIVGINTKEVVDIMAYVYEMDGCEEFDGLFEVFEKSNDILIELHLHKVRINRKRNIKNDKKDKPTEENKNELDFKNVDLEISRDMENLNLKGTVNDIPKSIGDKKPFESSEDFHLDKAKDLLINFKNPTLKFYIENLALFLSLKYDVDIFSKFISFINGGYKSICAKKIFKLTQVPEKNLGLLISGMEGVEKDILRADDLIVFPQTLNLYINWFISSIKGISIALVSEYIDLAKIFILFARKYKHPSLFKIFKSLWDCEIPNIDEQVKLSLIEFFTEIVEIFLSNDQIDLKEDLQEYWDKIDSLIEEDLQIKDTLQKIITEITSTQVYKKGFVRHLNVLKFFDQDFINASVSLLLTDFDLDWRYRLNLLEKCHENRDILRLNFREILQLFTKDKVFCVRMKALDIESKINDTIKDQ